MIVDAPASGHGLAMLTAPSTFGEIARVGPIRRQAFKVRDMLADPRRTGYVAVALPEEMPVNETLELGDAAARRRRPRARRDRRQRRLPGALQRQGGRARCARPAANGLPPEALAAVRAALAEHERARTQRSHLRRLKREARRARPHAARSCSTPRSGSTSTRTLAAKLGRDLG